MNLLPSNTPREPEQRKLSHAEIRIRLMTVATQIRDTKAARLHISATLPESSTKVWMISALDNRVVELTETVTLYAKALAGLAEVSFA